MRFTEKQLAAFSTQVQGNFVQRLAVRVTRGFGAPMSGDTSTRVRSLSEAAAAHGLRSCRAISAFVALAWLDGDALDTATLADATWGPPDARMMQLLDEALAPHGAEDRRRVAAMIDPSLAPAHETTTPRTALERMQPAPRGADERRSTPLWLARGPRDSLGNHWVTGLSESIVHVQAITRPADAATWSRIRWSGGAPIDGHPSVRRVPRDRPGHHRVLAELDGRCDVFHVWAVELRGGRLEPADAARYVPSVGESMRGDTRMRV